MDSFYQSVVFVFENIIKYSTLLLECVGVAVLLFTAVKAIVNLFRRKGNVRLTLAEGIALSLEFKLGGELLRVGADDVLGQLDLEAQLLGQALGDGREGVVHVELALRAAQMRAQNDGGAVVQQIFDGRQSRVDAGFIGDVLISVQRHVKVAADENLLALDVDVLDGFLVHG